jgi:transposase
MKQIDARKHSTEVQQELRKQIIRLRKQGRSNSDVALIVGVSQGHASRTWQKYKRGGLAAISSGKRGRRIGQQRVLAKEQEADIQRILIEKTPDQLKLPFALWTRRAVQLLIKQQFQLAMPIRTVGMYLQRWGFTPQKPIKRAYEQNPKAVQEWLSQKYPAIAARAKSEGAEIYWGDETGIQTDAYRDRGYAPIGKTPVVRLNVKRNSVSMISAINNQGKVRFMMYQKAMTSDLLIRFMKRLVKDSKSKVYLILDNLRAHHGKDVKLWLKEHQDEIEVFYLPSYSPELNPDEYLNGNLKVKVHSGYPARSEKDLTHKVHSFLKSLQKRPHHVRSYFKHPKASYAA